MAGSGTQNPWLEKRITSYVNQGIWVERISSTSIDKDDICLGLILSF